MHTPVQSTTPDLVPVQRALLSVSDKTGLIDFARALHEEFHIELVSTGGTAKTLRDAPGGGIPVKDISDLTGFPEMMDGRVKTLHPLVHGGFLALRDNPAHLASMQQHNIQPIDLIVVNLYPFEATIAKPNATFEEAIENIDIGGPAMIRSAAKNHRSIVVVTDTIQYEKVLKHLRRNKTPEGLGQTPYTFRLDLAMWAYSKTAQYDAAIYPYLGEKYFKDNAEKIPEQAGLLPLLTPRLKKLENLRYGENPHQLAAFYQTQSSSLIPHSSIATAKQLHGKALSYINILDADAAIELVREFPEPAAAVIKHTNPCGCATAPTLAQAFDLAYAGDPVAAFGGIVALNREVDESTATQIVSGKRFLEVVIAPSYTPPALAMLQDRWKDCRILATGDLTTTGSDKALHFRSVTGGMLVQQPDTAGFTRATCTVTSLRQPTDAEWADLAFIWLATKHVKSNAIAIAKNGQLLAAGAGQMSRPMSAKIAIELANKNGHSENLPGSVAGSDAFFPFPDAPELLITAGITAIIHPGGSKKDQETIDLCNLHNIALVTTGQRHFAH
jgi:phosphoribosylaminoimidazolecarboxamide formyltransferase/IMP cyclohydrolase